MVSSAKQGSRQEDTEWIGNWWQPKSPFLPSSHSQPSQVPFTKGRYPGQGTGLLPLQAQIQAGLGQTSLLSPDLGCGDETLQVQVWGPLKS